MKTLEVGKAADSLDRYTRKMGQETLFVTRNGLPVAALIPIDNGEMCPNLAANAKFLAIMERSRKEGKSKGTISLKKIRQELEK